MLSVESGTAIVFGGAFVTDFAKMAKSAPKAVNDIADKIHEFYLQYMFVYPQVKF